MHTYTAPKSTSESQKHKYSFSDSDEPICLWNGSDPAIRLLQEIWCNPVSNQCHKLLCSNNMQVTTCNTPKKLTKVDSTAINREKTQTWLGHVLRHESLLHDIIQGRMWVGEGYTR